VLLREL